MHRKRATEEVPNINNLGHPRHARDVHQSPNCLKSSTGMLEAYPGQNLPSFF
jgi:hypothetical protein